MKRFFRDMAKYWDFMVYMAKSELKSEVANSYLNWIWWILEPFCFMLIYWFIFGYVFKAKEQYFSCFIYIGITIWDFFSRVVRTSVTNVRNNKPIVSKVYLPKFALIIIKMLVNGFKMLISFGIVIVLMIFLHVPFTWHIIEIVPICMVLFVLTFGVSTFLLHFGVYVDDLANVTAIVLRMLMYLTGVFFDIEKRVPQYGTLLNKCNPVAFIMTSARKAILYGGDLSWKWMGIWFAVGLVISILGIRLIYRNENSYVKLI